MAEFSDWGPTEYVRTTLAIALVILLYYSTTMPNFLIIGALVVALVSIIDNDTENIISRSVDRLEESES